MGECVRTRVYVCVCWGGGGWGGGNITKQKWSVQPQRGGSGERWASGAQHPSVWSRDSQPCWITGAGVLFHLAF